MDMTQIEGPARYPLYVTCNEASILKLLEQFHKSDLCPSKADLRIAGGWVRDKLLKLESNDLDIALEDCYGKTYAEAFQRWLQLEGVSSLGSKIIPANPEKSKHLETAMLTLSDFGISLDFVNLRSEEYTAESRVPSMVFGSPKQDSERRDFTINALFYNVTKHEVEDYTKMGLEDLENGVLRTPLPAKQTFLDDPLRLIRAIRFLAKFPSFIPDPSIGASVASDSQVLEALDTKVSIDRVRNEVAKMIEYGDSAVRGFDYMREWGVMSHVIKIPVISPAEKLRKVETAGEESYQYFKDVARLLLTIRERKRVDLLSENHVFWNEKEFNRMEVRGALMFTALLICHFEGRLRDPDKKGTITPAECALVNLRARGVASQMVALHTTVKTLREVYQNLTMDRTKACAYLRSQVYGKWFDLAMVMAAALQLRAEPDETLRLEQTLQLATQLQCRIKDEWKLDQIWVMKPVFDGAAIRTILPNIPKGIAFKEVMEYQANWMAEHWHLRPAMPIDDLRNLLKEAFVAYV